MLREALANIKSSTVVVVNSTDGAASSPANTAAPPHTLNTERHGEHLLREGYTLLKRDELQSSFDTDRAHDIVMPIAVYLHTRLTAITLGRSVSKREADKLTLLKTVADIISGDVLMLNIDKLVTLTPQQLHALDIHNPPATTLSNTATLLMSLTQSASNESLASPYLDMYKQYKLLFDNVTLPILQTRKLSNNYKPVRSHLLLLSKDGCAAQTPHMDSCAGLYISAFYMNENNDSAVDATVMYECKYDVHPDTYARVYTDMHTPTTSITAVEPYTVNQMLGEQKPLIRAFGQSIDVEVGNPVFDDRYVRDWSTVMFSGLIPSSSLCIFSSTLPHNGPKVVQPGVRAVMFQACAHGAATANQDDVDAQTYEVAYAYDSYEMRVTTPVYAALVTADVKRRLYCLLVRDFDVVLEHYLADNAGVYANDKGKRMTDFIREHERQDSFEMSDYDEQHQSKRASINNHLQPVKKKLKRKRQ